MVGEAEQFAESPFCFDKQLVATATVCQQKAKISHVPHNPPPTTRQPSPPVLVTHHPPPTTHHPSSIIHHPSSIIHHPSSIIHDSQPSKSIMDYDLPHLA